MQTVSEKILSSHCGRTVSAGETVVCSVDCVIGTDGSGPMAIDYFEQMGGTTLFDPARVFFSLDHYAPPDTPQTIAFHQRIRDFAAAHGATVFDVGDGISHQIVVERGLVAAGDLVVGADSHTVTCGALNCFAIGVGSSDLAAAMMTGKIWLRVPDTIRVTLTGSRFAGWSAKDLALDLIAELGAEGANYQAIEFDGPALSALTFDDRLVLSNLMVEAGAKAAIFPYDQITDQYRQGRSGSSGTPVFPDNGARYSRQITRDLGTLSPRIARPHAPDNVVTLQTALGTPVQMVFIGTCTGGRVRDFHEAWQAFDRAGARFVGAGAIVTTAGCGACCGTSGVIPGDGMTVLSTANRNFKARMGNATAEIYLASPAVCGAAAATGRIPSEP